MTPPHEHTYATEWTSDNNHHWHASTCGHEEEVKDKAEHTWGAVTTTLEPTTTTVGKGTKECTICKHKVEVTIDKLPVYKFADGYDLDTTYNKKAFVLDKSQIINTETSKPIKEEEIESILYKLETEDEYTEVAPINAGTYNVKVKIKGHEITGKFTIKPIILTGIYKHPADLTYTGDYQYIADYTLDKSFAGVLEGDTVKVSGVKASINAGVDVMATNPGFSTNPNYELAIGGSYKVLVTIKPIEIKTPIKFEIPYQGVGPVIFYYSNWKDVPEVLEKDKEKLELCVQMKGYKVGAEYDSHWFDEKISEDSSDATENYTLAKEKLTATIVPAKLTLKTPFSIEYDGKTSDIVIPSENINGIADNEGITLKVTMNSVNVRAKATKCDIVASDETSNAGNYSIDLNHVKDNVSIVPVFLTSEQIIEKDFEYNGQKDFAIEDLTGFTNFVSQDGSLNDYKIIARFDSKDVGAKLESLALMKKSTGIVNENYRLDMEQFDLSIAPKVLKVKSATRPYDGTTIVSTEEYENMTTNDLIPILKISMSSKNVDEAKYQSHELVYTHSGPVINFTVDPNDPVMKNASITKKELQFPTYYITGYEDPNNEPRYRYFYLGQKDGAAEGEEIKVLYENKGKSWERGLSFKVNVGSPKFEILLGADKNYTVKAPFDSMIYVLKKPMNNTSTSLNNNIPIEFTITSKDNVFYTYNNINGSLKGYTVQVIDANGNIFRNITLNTDSQFLSYPYVSETDNGLKFNVDGDNKKMVQYFVYGLEPGTYKIKYWKNN